MKFYNYIKEKKLDLIGIFIFNIILQLAYILSYEKNSEWVYGYTPDYNFFKWLFSYLITALLYLMNEKIESNFIRLFNKIFIYLMFIPISVLYCIKNYSTLSFLLITLEFIIIIGGVLLLKKIQPNKHIEIKTLQKIENINLTNIIYVFFWMVTLFIIFCCFKYNGIPRLTALNLYNVYEVREQFYLPKYIQYLYDFVTKFIILFLMIVNLHKKSYKTFAFTVIIQLMFFLWKANKYVLFAGPLVIFLYVILNKLDFCKCFEKNIVWLIVDASIGTIILYALNVKLALSLFIRRFLLVPANLKFVYMDFFSNNPKLGIVGTILNSILKIENPYGEKNYLKIISDIYFNKPEMSSNTGFLVEGFVRWGYIGMIIIPIIYVIVLKILDNGSKNTSFPFMVSISTIPLILLNDGYLIPYLTFGALGILCFVSIFFKVDKLEKSKTFEKITNIFRKNKEKENINEET